MDEETSLDYLSTAPESITKPRKMPNNNKRQVRLEQVPEKVNPLALRLFLIYLQEVPQVFLFIGFNG